MSLMWMPAQTTVPPGASAGSARGTDSPAGAKMMAASEGLRCGGPLCPGPDRPHAPGEVLGRRDRRPG